MNEKRTTEKLFHYNISTSIQKQILNKNKNESKIKIIIGTDHQEIIYMNISKIVNICLVIKTKIKNININIRQHNLGYFF